MKSVEKIFLFIFSVFVFSVIHGMELKTGKQQKQQDFKMEIVYPNEVYQFFDLLKEFGRRSGTLENKNRRDFKALEKRFKELIEVEGFNVNAKNNEGYPLCCYATLYGCCAAIKTLHEAGADFHQADKNLWTPLHIAAYLGYGDIIDFFLQSAQFQGRMQEVCSRKTEMGQTPGFLAWESGHDAIAKKLGYVEAFDGANSQDA